MDSLDPASPAALAPSIPVPRPPRIWNFWETALWGLFVFAAMVAGQIAVVVLLMLRSSAPLDLDALRDLAGNGLTVSLSVMAGLPAVLAALWLAIRRTGIGFADYLALRWPSWTNLLIGVVGMVVLMASWELLSRAAGRDVAPGFMGEVLKSARADGALWLLVVAFSVGAPVSEEFFARGFLYRGWSQTSLGPAGAIALSSMVWTAVHLQYDWFFLVDVFSMGVFFGYLRYRSGSIWLTVILHGLNNLAAVVQTFLLAGQG